MNKENNILRVVFIVIILIFAGVYWIWKPDNPFQILALIGALSWLSILSNIIIKLVIKPSLEIISDNEIELGYTTLGPIFNLHLAYIVENKKALIRKVDLNLVHQNNDSNLLSWEWFEETLYTMNLPERDIPTRKNQKAIAINVNEGDMIEKKIGFQHNSFKSQYSQLIKETNQKYLNVVVEGGGEEVEMKKTDEYHKLNALFSNGFFWKIGNYEAEIRTYILGRKNPFIHKVKFELTNLDIVTITPNVETCKLMVENSYGVEKHESFPAWKWINKNKLEE